MIRDENNRERFYNRVKERRFWLRFGWVLLGSGFSLLILTTIGSFIDMPFSLVNPLTGMSIGGIILGSVFSLLLSRLGWSKSKPIDIIFNRFSIVLIISSQVLAVMNANLGYTLEPVDYTQVMLIAGIVLILLGIRFQSSTED